MYEEMKMVVNNESCLNVLSGRSTSWKQKNPIKEFCPRIRVPGTFQEYMRNLTSKIRYQLIKIRRDINNNSLFAIKKVRTASDLGQILNGFIWLHHKIGLPIAVKDIPFKRFLQESAAAFFRNGRLQSKRKFKNYIKKNYGRH